MIDRLSGRVALLIVVAATLAIVLLGWFVLLTPERNKATKLNTQIDDTNTQLQALTNLLQGPAARESLISQRLFEKAVPNNVNMSQILRQLSAYASTSGVSLLSITPGTLVPGAGTETQPIALTASGHYFGLRKFLTLVRTSADLQGDQVKATGRLYTVDNIQFSGGGSAAGSNGQTAPSSVVSATFGLNAFIYQPSAVAAVAVAPTTTTTSSSTTTP